MMKRLLKADLPGRLAKLSLTVSALLLLCSAGLSAQTLKLNYSNVPIKTVLAEIENQTDYSFVYSSSTVDVEKRISVNLPNNEIHTVLTNVLTNNGISYRISGNQIILAPAAQAAAQPSGPITPELTGVIRDENNLPLPGAYVIVENTQINAVTDRNGEFVLRNVPANSTISIRFMGYETMSVPAGSRTKLNIQLQPDATTINEVMVTGYSTISKERATGAFNKVAGADIERRHVSDLSTALLGSVAGMQGKENEDGTVDYTIRGISSLTTGIAEPLIVVDGFPVANGFRDINPNDVADITVLKDAAAASIWGARSANGVIVITTKRATEKGTSVTVNSMVRVGKKLDLGTVLTTASSADHVAYEKLAYENEWFMNQYGGTFQQISYSLTMAQEKLYDYYTRGIGTEAELDRYLADLASRNNRGQIKDHLLKNPLLQQHNVTISNATDRSNTYLSLMYENEIGKVINNKTDRFRINFNNTTKVFKWLDFNFSTNIHYVDAETSGPTIDEISMLNPYEMIYNQDGSYAEQLSRHNREQVATIPKGVMPYDDWSYNILRESNARKFTNEALNTRVQAGLTFKILDGLTATSSIQYELNKTDHKEIYYEDSYEVRRMVNYYTTYDQATQTAGALGVPKGALVRTNRPDPNVPNRYLPNRVEDRNYVFRNQINFDRTFASKHAVSALAGIEIHEYKMNSETDPWIYGFNPDRNAVGRVANGGINVRDITGGLYNELGGMNAAKGYRLDRYVSYYGNASYTYDGKYSLTGSMRRDGSNFVGTKPSARWSSFWSVGGLWNLSRENFMEGSRSWLDRLSVRLTYGYNGNAELSTSPLTLLTMGASPSTAFNNRFTASINNFGNDDLTWEKTRTVNMGFDFAMFKNKLFGSIDIYDKLGQDIVGARQMPTVYGMGYTPYKLNNAEISNRGFELELGTRIPVASIGLTFGASLSYSYNKNEVKSLFYPSYYSIDMVKNNAFVEGYPIGTLWSYEYIGMNDGIPYVKGVNGEPSSMNDVALHLRTIGVGLLKDMGPSIAPHYAGFTAEVSGYGFHFSARLTSSFGGHFRNPVFGYNNVGAGKSVVSDQVKYVLQGSDKVPGFPAFRENKQYLWDRYVPHLSSMVEKSDFIKLKEINLEYTLPKRWTDFIGFESARVYTQVRDLGCLWTNNSRGYDPEWLPGTMKPVTTFVFGLNLSF